MRVIDKRIKLSRREMLKTSGASAVAMTSSWSLRKFPSGSASGGGAFAFHA